MPMRIVHRLAMEFPPLRRRMRTTFGKRSMITMTIVEVMIDMAVEVGGTMKPRSGPDEHPALEPFRPVIAIRRAIVGRNFIVAVGTYRRRPDLNRNLCRSLIRGSKK